MSAYTIRMDFKRAKEKAEDLEEVSQELKKLASGPYDASLEQLSRHWKGENASSYIKKGGDLREQMLKTAQELGNTAQVIRQIAREIYEAEMEAWRIVHDRD